MLAYTAVLPARYEGHLRQQMTVQPPQQHKVVRSGRGFICRIGRVVYRLFAYHANTAVAGCKRAHKRTGSFPTWAV